MTAVPAETHVSPATFSDGPRLLAEIGPTHAVVALETGSGILAGHARLDCAAFDGFLPLLRACLAQYPGVAIAHAALALATPVEGDIIQMAHRDWTCSTEQLRIESGLSTLLVVNDFTALAMAVPGLQPAQLQQIGGGTRQLQAVAGVIGPGEGLGMSGVVPATDGIVTLASEGGHAGFAPYDAREFAVMQYAWTDWPHVSCERLLSLSGMELVERALADAGGVQAPPRSAPQIIDAALDQGDAHCRQVLDTFAGMLGSVAANLALTLGALGGIFIDAGRLPRLAQWLVDSPFRARFEAKGRLAAYMAGIPTYVITAPNPALAGVSVILAAHLGKQEGGSGLIERLRQRQASLAPAERRVAALVLAQPRRILSEPIADIARLAQVSQPTVIRFCRSLGYQGLAEFKLKLSGSLGGSIAVRHSQVGRGDTAHDLSAKVVDNTVAALVAFREQVDVAALERATRLLRGAQRIELFAPGEARATALDGQKRLLQLHIPAALHGDADTFLLTASVLGHASVVLILAATEPLPALLAAASMASERGAEVVAIGPAKSPLQQYCSVYLGVDEVSESTQGLLRLQQALLMEMLLLGLALAR